MRGIGKVTWSKEEEGEDPVESLQNYYRNSVLFAEFLHTSQGERSWDSKQTSSIFHCQH